jgi:hypothetical protein
MTAGFHDEHAKLMLRAGSTEVQVHRSIDNDDDGDCEPSFPQSNNIAVARARQLGA